MRHGQGAPATDAPSARHPRQSRLHPAAALVGLLISVVAVGGCGKKGPPLPPLLLLPAAPGESVAVRRGSVVEVQFVTPKANTNGSSPADLERVDVYGLTGEAASGDDIVRRGSRIGSVLVNPPPDPDEDPDAVKPADAAPKRGIDQGAVGRVTEDIAGISASVPRSYVSVGINGSGRRGPASPPSPVPLGPPPPAPPAVTVTYTETAINVGWTAAAIAPPATAAYHVYEPGPPARRLSPRALAEPPYSDSRVEWGTERCFVVRTEQTSEGLTMESEASEPGCVTLTDTFPPTPPTGLTAVASAGAISLIWNASTATDVAGYLVLRASGPADTPVRVTPEPIVETTFRDTVAAGVRAIYTVQAVDRAGNVSPMSAPVEESAR